MGMVLIIMGLYFFLWGKKNDTPNAEAVEESTSIPNVPQSTSTVVPNASPINTSVVLEIEKTDQVKNETKR